MGNWTYTEEELKDYFHGSRGGRRSASSPENANGSRRSRPRTGAAGFFHRRFKDPEKAQAALYVSGITAVLLLFTAIFGIYFLTVSDDLPSFAQLDNPDVVHATVAYTADNVELARYFSQNRSWVSFEQISPHVVNALIATEDHRFYDHWGIDLYGVAAAGFDAVFRFDLRGASTITQQLARNLYNEQIGREVNLERKLKEMVTAVQIERRYTKREIVEMYLNTVEFVYQAFGIEAAAQTFFNKSARELDVAESATLVGMLQNPSRYNPVRREVSTRSRRNEVLWKMVKNNFISRDLYVTVREQPIELDFKSAEITESIAPYFAMEVQEWLKRWSQESGVNFYREGLIVHTTLDSRLQELAQQAVDEQMTGLQAVVDYEWSRGSGGARWNETDPYLTVSDYEPFSYFWRTKRREVDRFISGTERFRSLRESGMSQNDAVARLREDQAFMDSLKYEKTRLQAGMVSIDPRNGYVKAWVGGRDLKTEWYDHVTKAARQPGSTFKPFVYAAAVDNNYSPRYMLPDTSYTYVDPVTNQVWRPRNFGSGSGVGMMSLEEALATSNNHVTARVITQLVTPQQVVQYARAMGIKSRLDPVPALGLGTSDVTLLELTAAYSTFANGGLAYEPTLVTRIEDRRGNVLFEANPAPEEALSQETAYTIVDMLRSAVGPGGTASRVNWKFGLHEYDLAAKTGTTQQAADTWFMMMHPELVTGAWVGFNERAITFRDTFWGQGAHTALLLVADFFSRASKSREIGLTKERFPTPRYFDHYGTDPPFAPVLGPDGEAEPEARDRERVGW